jgi:hypothetical protein
LPFVSHALKKQIGVYRVEDQEASSETSEIMP